MKRTPLRRVGARAKREAEALKAFREAVLERAAGRCERCLERRDLHAHHIKPRSRRPSSHDPSNGAALCFSCHRGAHDHTIPDWRDWIR